MKFANKKTVSITPDKDLIEEIDERARRRGISRTKYIEAAVKFAVENESKIPELVEMARAWQEAGHQAG